MLGILSSVIKNTIEKLLNCNVSELSNIGKSGNSSVFKIKIASGDVFAVKFYPSLVLDSRDRIGVEYEALNFFYSIEGINVPKPIAINAEDLLAVYEWIPGARPQINLSSVKAMLAFMKTSNDIRESADARRMKFAIDCCLSGESIQGQLLKRVSRLEAVVDDVDLEKFINLKFKKLLNELDFESQILGPEFCCLSPGDFGPHNMIFDNQKYYFIDMEYFGWDDPVKQVCDVILHPGFILPKELSNFFLIESVKLYGHYDTEFRNRLLKHFLPFGLRWILIILNEFLPEKWNIKVHAGNDNYDYKKKIQLAKADNLFDSLLEKHTNLKRLLL
jgi:hypothetical protein